LQAFVGAYNTLQSTLGNLTAYNASTKTASALTGDSLARQAQAQVRNALSALTPGASGGVRSLFDLGISGNDDGSLTLDTGKLGSALSGGFDAAKSLLAADGPVGSALTTALNGFIGTNGALQSRTDSLGKRLDDISKQKSDLDERMSALSARYTAQYSALDSLMAQMNTTSTFLTNQFTQMRANNNA